MPTPTTLQCPEKRFLDEVLRANVREARVTSENGFRRGCEAGRRHVSVLELRQGRSNLSLRRNSVTGV